MGRQSAVEVDQARTNATAEADVASDRRREKSRVMFGGDNFEMATITSTGPDGLTRVITRSSWAERESVLVAFLRLPSRTPSPRPPGHTSAVAVFSVLFFGQDPSRFDGLHGLDVTSGYDPKRQHWYMRGSLLRPTTNGG